MLSIAIATTGTDTATDDVIAVSVHPDNGAAYTNYYQCNSVIPAKATLVHKISKNMTAWGNRPEVLHQHLHQILDSTTEPVIMFNAPWVWAMLTADADQHNAPLTPPAGGVIDPLYLDHTFQPGRGITRTLEDVAHRAGVSSDAPAGPPWVNADLALQIAHAQLAKMGDITPQELAGQLGQTYYEIEDEYAGYLATTGRAAKPVLPYPGVTKQRLY